MHATDPSAQGAQVKTSDFEQHLEAARAETRNEIAGDAKRLIDAVGGPREASSAEIWEGHGGLKESLSSYAHGEVMNAVLATPEVEGDKNPFDAVVSAVRGDMLQYGSGKAVDATGFHVGRELAELAGDLDDPDTLDKATKTVRLLALTGAYKLARWGNGNQLEDALAVADAFSEKVPGFDPFEAGSDEVRTTLTSIASAVEADQQTKPNYKFAKPERSSLVQSATQGLDALDRMQARMSVE